MTSFLSLLSKIRAKALKAAPLLPPSAEVLEYALQQHAFAQWAARKSEITLTLIATDLVEVERAEEKP